MKTGGLIVLAFCACQLFSAGAQELETVSFAGDGILKVVTFTGCSAPGAWIGTLDGTAGERNATLVETRTGWVMDVDDRLADAVWHVVCRGGETVVQRRGKVRRARAACVAHHEIPEAPLAKGFAKIALGSLTSGWPVDPVGNEIDILVVFDQTAADYLVTQDLTMEAFAASQIAKMNAALENSGLSGDFKMALGGVYKSSLSVLKDCGSDPDSYLNVAINRMDSSSAAPWKAIRTERDRIGADLVVMLANTQPSEEPEYIGGLVGISWGLENDAAHKKYGLTKAIADTYRAGAFGACDIRVCERDNTFGHEVGHMMGAGHSNLLSPTYSNPGPQLFNYSSALMFLDPVDGEYYYTIMGYNSTDGGSYPTYSELPYYSSPELVHPVTGTALGDASHDNVRSLRETYPLIAQYRVRGGKGSVATLPEAWTKARKLSCVMESGDGSPVGILSLKVGKGSSKTMGAKVSGSYVDLKTKKVSAKAVSGTIANGSLTVSLTVKGSTVPLVVTVSEKGIESATWGTTVLSALTPAGALSRTAAAVTLPEAFTLVPGELRELLPIAGEVFTATEKKWTFPKATKVKLAKVKGAPEPVLTVDDKDGRTNGSAMKLSYKATTGIFKGSFKVYAIDTSSGKQKLKKYTVAVTGIVAGGKGYGQAVCKKPAAGPWVISVE